MSIATLKKKTEAKYNNISVSQPLFSLNGTYRNQGYVGQTSLSRSLPRTLIKNGGFKNYGGCCGTFKIGQIVQSSIKSTENNTVVKGSTLNTRGLLHVNKYTCLWRPAPYTAVKLDSTHHMNTSADYTKYLQKKTITKADACRAENPDPCNTINTNCKLVRPRYTPFKKVGKWTKPVSDLAAVSQGEYLLYRLHKKCSEIDEEKYSQQINNCTKCALPGNR